MTAENTDLSHNKPAFQSGIAAVAYPDIELARLLSELHVLPAEGHVIGSQDELDRWSISGFQSAS